MAKVPRFKQHSNHEPLSGNNPFPGHNSSVVATFKQIKQHGWDAFRWRSHPNRDLWEKIGRILQHKNQGDVKIEKIKAHREPEKAAGEEALWGIIGNSKADEDAKKALYEDLVLHSTNGQIIKKRIQQQIEVAYLCSRMPQDITKHAESLRKERDKQERVQEPEQPLPLAARGVCSSHFPKVSICPNPPPECANWDPLWFKLVARHFSQLKWPDPREELQGFVSCLELMLDLFLAYQTLGPVNITKIPGGKKIPIPLEARCIVTNQRAYYHLLNYSQRTLLPNPLLTDCTHTWLRTLDLLKGIPMSSCGQTEPLHT